MKPSPRPRNNPNSHPTPLVFWLGWRFRGVPVAFTKDAIVAAQSFIKPSFSYDAVGLLFTGQSSLGEVFGF